MLILFNIFCHNNMNSMANQRCQMHINVNIFCLFVSNTCLKGVQKNYTLCQSHIIQWKPINIREWDLHLFQISLAYHTRVMPFFSPKN